MNFSRNLTNYQIMLLLVFSATFADSKINEQINKINSAVSAHQRMIRKQTKSK